MKHKRIRVFIYVRKYKNKSEQDERAEPNKASTNPVTYEIPRTINRSSFSSFCQRFSFCTIQNIFKKTQNNEKILLKPKK